MKYCKHFIGYANHSTLYINLPKLKGTLTIFEKVKYVSFILEEKQRWTKKYNEIWEKVEVFIGRDFDVEVVHNDRCIPTVKIEPISIVMHYHQKKTQCLWHIW